MKTIFYGKNYLFELNDEEFKAFIKALETSKRVWIPRLKVFLSDMFIWAGDKPEYLSSDQRTLHDGTRAVLRFGRWVSETDESIKIDLSYYPELRQPVNQEHKALGKGETFIRKNFPAI